jgi:hypothetical protein
MSLSSWGMRLAGFDATLALLQSLKFEFGDGVIYVAGPTVDYAVYHELGTSKMEARPFMRPAAERVQADPIKHAMSMASTHGIDITNEEGLIRALALAVQNEGKRIANAKDIRDTGDLIASISIQKVS